MRNYKEHILHKDATLKMALTALNKLGSDAILFVVNENKKLIGSLTDGDVRRGLLKGRSIEDNVMGYIRANPKSIRKKQYCVQEIIALRDQNFKILPVLDERENIINVINFNVQSSYLPMDALVMAGGRGSRLKPMTDRVPKPLLRVGGKAIIDHNVDRLRRFGIDDFHVSVRYLGDQLVQHYMQRALHGLKMNFVWEEEALGTLGAASLIKEFQHDYVLITNSDVLTTLDYEDFFLDFLEKGADMSVATIPYKIDIPYAVMETNNHIVTSFKEKPTYTYFSNGGIYIVKRELLKRVPKNSFYNATDLMNELISKGGKLVSYPIRQYWLDIGNPEDFKKAQSDINHLDLL